MRKIPLLFSDVSFGTEEFGFLPRVEEPDLDEEEIRYARYVRTQRKGKVRCLDGYLYLEDSQ